MNKATKRILFWTGAALVIAASVFIVIQGAEPSSNTDISVGEIAETDWSKGNPEAKVTLIEYSDFQCPACASFAALVDNMMKEYGSHVHFAYRHFPLKSIHPNATLAARAANAAGEQGQFFEMHNLLFLNTDYWASKNPKEAEDAFAELAVSLEIDPQKFLGL
ncbi:thioredoxin domain-containing protein [Candidatus Peregrinibacteria bacterium]|nr:thioredoxin domain-containing protein [Candidatus Peregrinibacteria bacterium]